MDPLIGLVNQIQMTRGSDLGSPPPLSGVWFGVWPVGGGCDILFFLPSPFIETQKHLSPLVRGQQTKDLVKGEKKNSAGLSCRAESGLNRKECGGSVMSPQGEKLKVPHSWIIFRKTTSER